LLWEHLFNPGDGHQIEILGDDSLVIAAGGKTNLDEPFVARIDPLGQVLWDMSLSVPGCTTFHCTFFVGDIVARPDLTVTLATSVYCDYCSPGASLLLLDIDGSGAYQTHRLYDTEEVFRQVHAEATSEGGLMLVVNEDQAGTLMIKFDSSDTVLWSKLLDLPLGLAGTIREMVLADDDSVLLASIGDDGVPFVDPEVRKVSPDGDALWGLGHICSTTTVTSQFHTIERTGDGRFAAGGVCGGCAVMVFNEDGIVDESCTTESVTLTTEDIVIAEESATIEVAPGDHAEDFSPTQMEDVIIYVFPDCSGPPSEVSPAGAVQSLVFQDKAGFTWDEAASSGSEWFNVYKGTLQGLPIGDYGECFLPAVLVNSAIDLDSPLSTVGWTYLVSGENGSGEGPLGYDSAGSERPNDTPCMP
jgi:hypothetical protein